MDREEIYEIYQDDMMMFADGFDDAIIGVDTTNYNVVYSVAKCIHVCMDQGMEYEEAVEHLEFNTFHAYMGDRTPIFVYD